MNKYFKKFGIMLVMALILSLGFCISAFAADTSQTVKINNSILSFNKVVYVDATNGDDSNGNGGINSPFKSIKKGMDSLNSNSTYRTNCAIVLKKGSYDITNCVQGASYNMNPQYNGMKISWIANKGDEGTVFINSNSGFENIVVEINPSYRIKMSFYGLVFKDIKNDYFTLGGDDWTNEYYNCVFDNVAVGGYSRIVSNANVIVQNCLFNNCKEILSDMPVSGKCINTISTNELVQPVKGTKTNVLYDGKVDVNYNIISDGWENAGTGINPDGKQANIGVYGGDFAWGEWPSKEDESITLDKSTMDLNVGDTQQLTATTTPAAVGVTWTVSDPTVATIEVDPTNGKITKITTLKEGTCTITATTDDGSNLSASCVINVTKKDEPSNPTNPDDPTDNKTGAILIVNLTDGETKVFDVSASEAAKFKEWYNTKTEYENQITYEFDKTVNSSISIEEDVVHDQVTSYEIRKY